MQISDLRRRAERIQNNAHALKKMNLMTRAEHAQYLAEDMATFMGDVVDCLEQLQPYADEVSDG